MFTFIGERYYNDYNRIRVRKSFYSLENFYNWAKEISNNFTDQYNNWFPSLIGGDVGRISIDDGTNPGWNFFFYQIENENGIVFSTGKLTNGEKFCAKKVKEWCIECQKKMKEAQRRPNFVEC